VSAFHDEQNPAPSAERSGARAPAQEGGAQDLSQQEGAPGSSIATTNPASGLATPYGGIEPLPLMVPVVRDPAWSGLDVLRLIILAIVALFIGVFAVLFAARLWIYPHASVPDLARVPLVVVGGQALAYLLLLGYMYVLVTRERGRPDFLNAMHWNWPRNFGPYILAGIALSIGLQALAHFLPMPKELPIDTFFRTPAEAWALSIFGMTLAPLMEELFFRGFLYPVLTRGVGMTASIFITALAFALLHGSQLMFAWGPVLVIFLVGTVLTMIRAHKNSVAAGLVVHMAYNGTISVLMFLATDGFRHLEKLNQ
jgi:membrane protease YdiL (CAAX protease family)